MFFLSFERVRVAASPHEGTHNTLRGRLFSSLCQSSSRLLKDSLTAAVLYSEVIMYSAGHDRQCITVSSHFGVHLMLCQPSVVQRVIFSLRISNYLSLRTIITFFSLLPSSSSHADHAHAAEISLQHDHVQAGLVLLLLYQPGLTYYWCGLP